MNREDLRTVLKLMNEGYKEMNVEFDYYMKEFVI